MTSKLKVQKLYSIVEHLYCFCIVIMNRDCILVGFTTAYAISD